MRKLNFRFDVTKTFIFCATFLWIIHLYGRFSFSLKRKRKREKTALKTCAYINMLLLPHLFPSANLFDMPCTCSSIHSFQCSEQHNRHSSAAKINKKWIEWRGSQTKSINIQKLTCRDIHIEMCVYIHNTRFAHHARRNCTITPATRAKWNNNNGRIKME